MLFKGKFITEFISAIKNAKKINLKEIESLENGRKLKKWIFCYSERKHFEIYEKLKKSLKKLKKYPQKSIIDNIHFAQKLSRFYLP